MEVTPEGERRADFIAEAQGGFYSRSIQRWALFTYVELVSQFQAHAAVFLIPPRILFVRKTLNCAVAGHNTVFALIKVKRGWTARGAGTLRR